MIMVHHFQGFDFLTSYVYLLCILFFFWSNSLEFQIVSGTEINLKQKNSTQNKRRRRTGKKVRLRVYKLCIIFSYKKNRDIFISLCGQESSIIAELHG